MFTIFRSVASFGLGWESSCLCARRHTFTLKVDMMIRAMPALRNRNTASAQFI
jgi:hypothetical protein